YVFFFSVGRRHTRAKRDWSSDVCSSDLCVMHSQAPTSTRSNAGPSGPAFDLVDVGACECITQFTQVGMHHSSLPLPTVPTARTEGRSWKVLGVGTVTEVTER